jgi:tripartite-type tricarboxylate transporter receptor subunit TctC
MNFVPVTNMGKSPLAFYAKPNSTVDTPEKLIAEIKAGRRPINFAVGGAAHKLAVEYLVTGIGPAQDTVETLMYRGPAQAMNDVIAGQVEFGVFPVAVGAPMVAAGKIKVIGITGETLLPGLEPYKLMNHYVPGLNLYACWNLILPPGTPQEVQDWYAKHFVTVVNSSQTKEIYKKQFIFADINAQTPAGVRADMHRLREKWQPFARKIRPE